MKIRKDYFRIKILELLLYLKALEIDDHKQEKPYFYKSQVEKIRRIHKLITENLDKSFTIAELSSRFEISTTALKKCFYGVYGSPIFSYIKAYKLCGNSFAWE